MFCPQCGKETTKDDLFCGNCGKQLRAVFVPLKPQPGAQQNKASNTQPKPAQSSYPSAFSKPQAGSTSKYAPKPQPISAPKAQPVSTPKPQTDSAPKPQPVSTPKPQPKPQPQPQPQQVSTPTPEPQPVSSPKPEQSAAPNAAPKPIQAVVSIHQQGNLPKEVCYNAEGKLTWFYRDYEKDPSGNYVIRYVFEDDCIAKYDGINLSDKAGLEAEINARYYYKRVTIVERHEETGWIYFRHGIDRYFLQVSNAQFDYILAEFMKRCPHSEMGIVKVWKG